MDFRNGGNKPQDGQDVNPEDVIMATRWGTLPMVDFLAWRDSVRSGAHARKQKTWEAIARAQHRVRVAQGPPIPWPQYWAAWREATQYYIAIMRARREAATKCN